MAWSLAHVHPSIRSSLVAVARNKRVLSRDVREQFNALIVGPLLENLALFTENPCIFLIDALDEGMHEDHQVWSLFLETLSMFNQSLAAANYRLIVSSRDLLDIGDYISVCSRRVHLSVGPDHAQEGTEEWQDIYTLLSAHLGSASGCFNPLTNDVLREISDKASGLFVWASTAIKYVRKGRQIYGSRVPALLSCLEDDPESGLPVAAINRLYTQVLTTAFHNLRQEAERKAVRLFLSITRLSGEGDLLSLDEMAKLDNSLRPLDARLIGDLLPLLTARSDEGSPAYVLSHPSVAEFVLICMEQHEFGLAFQDSVRILLGRDNSQLLDFAEERMSCIKLFKNCVQNLEDLLERASQADLVVTPSVVNSISLTFEAASKLAVCINSGDDLVASASIALHSWPYMISSFRAFLRDGEEIPCVLVTAESPETLTGLPDSLRDEVTELVNIMRTLGEVDEQDLSYAPQWTRQKDAVVQGKTLLARLEEECCLYKFESYE